MRPPRRLGELRLSILGLAGCLALVAWVQRHALLSFFGPDDLIHLEQAVGLRPTLPTPLRYLTQVLYFRTMVHVVGLNPLAFHAIGLLVHLLVLCALYALFRATGFVRGVALTAVALFGMMLLHVVLLSAAVGINDETALLFALVGLLLTARGQRVLGGLTYALSLFCKESVFFLPYALLVQRQRIALRATLARMWLVIVITLSFAVISIALRARGLAPAGAAYSFQIGSNVFHNLMTYSVWSIDLLHPNPDLVSSFNTTAWHVGLPLYLAIGLLYWRLPSERFAIRFGMAWWLLGLLPVLGLEFQTYRHYLYPALPGLALVAASLMVRFVSSAVVVVAATAKRRAAIAALILAVLVVSYAARANRLITRRLGSDRSRNQPTAGSLRAPADHRPTRVGELGSAARRLFQKGRDFHPGRRGTDPRSKIGPCVPDHPVRTTTL
jgi:hypothetical protein